MAFQSFGSGLGTLLTPFPEFNEGSLNDANVTLDAAGESLTGIGRVILSSGPGTTKTLSSSGGRIFFRAASVTFSNGSSNLRVGVQDVGATGLEDGTFDAYADLTGGGGGVSANAVNSIAVTTGSKSITYGDLVAISVELTARGGADSVQVVRANYSSSLPYITADTGSGPGKGTTPPLFAFLCDDGTLGWMRLTPMIMESSGNFASDSTPDEHALIFTLPFPAVAHGLHAKLTNLAATDDFELILYSDPLGTPVAERTLSQDMDLGSFGSYFDRGFTSGYTLQANTAYAVALRPTTTNQLAYNRMNFGTGNGALRLATSLGTNWYLATRSNQSGAFGSENTNVLPQFGVWLGQLDDGAGGGGASGGAHIFGGTVVR